MKKQTKLLLIVIGSSVLLLVAVIGFALLFSQQSAPQKKEVKIFKIEAQSDNVFQGIVTAKQEENEFLDASLGTLEKVHVKNAQEIKVGDVLLTYTAKATDIVSLEYAVKNAQLSLNNAQENLASHQTQLAQLQTQYNQALTNQKKAKKNPTNPEDLMTSDPQSIQTQIDTINQTLQQDQQGIATAQLALEQAQANLTQAQNAQSINIKAKQAGIVILGNQNDKTAPLVKILSKETLIQAQVSEFDYQQVKTGEQVKIKTANLNQTVEGKITAVSPVPMSAAPSTTASSSTNSTAFYSFTVQPNKNLQYGYNVQVSVPDSDLLIPTSAVKDKMVQLKQKDGSFKAVKVIVEAKNGRLKVLSGLKVGDEIAEDGNAHD